jgi:PPE-repeat protein
MDFGALPPEINSARMYAGPGTAPMMAAAAAWNSLAAELASTAAGYESVITELTGEWQGPASASMLAAVQPYVAWLNVTAGHAQRAASQATASAAAFETAFAVTVPPPVIAVNRAQLAALVATNFLGVNTPAIMATEADYAAMWAQDAAAMYGYAAASAIAGILNPLTPPAPAASPAAEAGLMQAISSLPNAVAALASPAAAVPAQATPILGYPIVANSINGVVNSISWWVMNTIPNSVLLSRTINAAPATALATTSAPAIAVTPAAATGFGGTPVLAGLGQASTVGGLSVPASWPAAAPAASPTASAGSGWAVNPEEATPVTAVPAGMPMTMAGTSQGFGGPRYGFKPIVMPKTVLA